MGRRNRQLSKHWRQGSRRHSSTVGHAGTEIKPLQATFLPTKLQRSFRGQHFEGALITAAVALAIANLVPLEAIATMGSAGFLLLFIAVNIANLRLARDTGSRSWISGLAALSTAIALIVLCVEVDENPATRNHPWILVGMILLSAGIEFIYRCFTGRSPHLVRNGVKDRAETSGADHQYNIEHLPRAPMHG